MEKTTESEKQLDKKAQKIKGMGLVDFGLTVFGVTFAGLGLFTWIMCRVQV